MNQTKTESSFPVYGTIVTWRHWVAGKEPVYLRARVIGRSLKRVRIETLDGIPVKRSVHRENICLMTEDFETWKKERDWMEKEHR
jgi:hypothetical protein